MTKYTEFAKIFDHSEIGQILVQRGYDDEDERPILKLTFFDEESNGYASLTIGFEDSDDGQDDLDNAFENYTLEKAAKDIYKLKKFMGGSK